VLIAFRIAYTLGQAVCGRLLDRLGSRRGLSLTVAWYATIAMLTATARGIGSFRAFRFLLGVGESANWPGAAKAVSEWFPARERAWAVALYDSGSSIGGAIAPFLVIGIYKYFGSWRPAFLVTGSLGLLWIVAWTRVHAVADARAAAPPPPPGERVGWGYLLRFRQTWGIVIGRTLLDPYWFFMSEWFPLYLMSKGHNVEQSILGFWAPFLAGDLGNFFGGGLSSYWIKRGWPVGRARRTVILVFGPSMLLLIAATMTANFMALVAIFSWVTFAYACCATMFLALPADVYDTRAVATVSGLSGAGAGVGTLLSTYLIGRISDRVSFEPVIWAGAIVPCIATIVFLTMVRGSRRSDPERVLQPFE
jgi:MFS transporter, ACS family, hexuronate transporter